MPLMASSISNQARDTKPKARERILQITQKLTMRVCPTVCRFPKSTFLTDLSLDLMRVLWALVANKLKAYLRCQWSTHILDTTALFRDKALKFRQVWSETLAFQSWDKQSHNYFSTKLRLSTAIICMKTMKQLNLDKLQFWTATIWSRTDHVARKKFSYQW